MADNTLSDSLIQKIAEAVGAATTKATLESDERRGKVVEDPRPSKKSSLNPRGNEPGYTKPELSRQTIFCGHEEQASRLSPAEIELYNKITKPGRYNERKWVVIIRSTEEDSEKQTLEIRIPCREIADRMAMPTSLVAILNQIIAEQEQAEPDKKSK